MQPDEREELFIRSGVARIFPKEIAYGKKFNGKEAFEKIK